MDSKSILLFKKAGLFLALLLFSAAGTHAATKARGRYLGLEAGYNQNGNSFHVGFRYLTSIRLGGSGRAVFDIQPTFGIGSGYNQVFRFEGGVNFGIGAEMDQVSFSFLMIGAHLQLNFTLGNFGGRGVAFGVGPSLIFPLSANIYWKSCLFGLHWGMDFDWWIALQGTTRYTGYQSPFYVRVIAAFKF